ncbi:MAG: large conductance mechanosensitive channel protein MscL [Microlunatus sp.]
MANKTLEGLKDFLLRGNLIELAVAVIMGTTFGAVVTAFTDLLLDIIGKFFGTPNFSQVAVGGINLGAFLSALFTFLLTGIVIYFFVITPFNKFAEITKKDEPEAAAASTEDLLAEIRDLLKAQADKQQT